jgi:phosphoribosylglycinamide formyltransferase-1
MSKPKLVIFASGTKDGGGSGFENLVTSAELDAEILGVISNNENGGVRMRADRLGAPFIYFSGPFNEVGYHAVLDKTGVKQGRIWAALSGWLKKVEGLDPASTINIHPALLSGANRRFGGPGLYGHHVHGAVKQALDAGEIRETGISMHFVTKEYDGGPIFFEYRVALREGMNVDEIAQEVNQVEHVWQPKITNMVIHKEISWDGKDPKSLKVPANYEYLPKVL